MRHWRWSGITTSTGEHQKGTVPGATEAEARAQIALRHAGVSVRWVRPAMPGAGAMSEKSFSAKQKDVAKMFRGMATSVAAGMSVRESLEAEAEAAEQSGSSAANLTADLLARDEDLAEALRRHAPVVGSSPAAVVKAGEETGTLAAMLDGLATTMEDSFEMRSKIKSALRLPAITFVIILAVGAGTILYVIPKAAEILTLTSSGPGGEGPPPLPQPTRAMVGFSEAIQSNWIVMLVLMAVLFIAAVVAISKESVKVQMSRAVLKIPGVGAVVAGGATTVMCQTMGLLLGAGVDSRTALQMTVGATPSRWMARFLEQAELNCAQGMSLAESLEGLCPPLDRHLPHLGRQSATTADPGEPWRRFAARVNTETKRQMEGIQQAMQPTLIIILGGMVLLVGAATIRPLLQGFESF